MSDYKLQGRGNTKGYDNYYKGMDKSKKQKIAMASAFLLLSPGSLIADMGSGSGAASDMLAHIFSQSKVLGIDIDKKAIARSKREYKRKNLSFRVGDVEHNICGNESLDAILNSSTLHHVYSFNDYTIVNVHNCIANHVAQLKDDGVFLLRDFVSPGKDKSVLLRLHNPEEQKLLLEFSRTARSLETHRLNGFFIEALSNDLFRLNAHDMAEFVLRKDYREDWEEELKEQYCYFSQEEFEDTFAQHGLRVLVSAPYVNPWIVENRFKPSFEVFDENENRLDWPATNFMIAGEKTKGGIRIREHRLSTERCGFLKERFYRDSQGNDHHVISRPGQAHDILPYYIDVDSVYVLVKHGYPRPLINVERRGTPNIDKKRFAGYVTESLCGIGSAEAILHNAGITKFHDLKEQDYYYTAPEYLDEKVESSFVELDSMIDTKPMHKQTDFEDSGKLKMLSIQDVLRSAQVGSLPDARLELQCYRLLRALRWSVDPWIGTVPRIHTCDPLKDPSKISDLSFTEKLRGIQASFQIKRSLFQEEGFRDGSLTHLHSSELEFAVPIYDSFNTVSHVFVQYSKTKHSESKYCVFITHKQLPSIMHHEANCAIKTAFSNRLPKSVSDFQQLEQHILSLESVPISSANADFQLLGNGYFTSIGVSPEKMYPAIISSEGPLDMHHISGQWYDLHSLFFGYAEIKDVNLSIILYRLVHSLGLWDEYFCKK